MLIIFLTQHCLTVQQESIKYFLLQILDGTQYLHQKNVVHRDLKPENVMADSSGELKIIDLGVSKSLQKQLATLKAVNMMTTLVGTPYYMAPEIIKVNNGKRQGYDNKVDIFAIGIMTYEMLIGKPRTCHCLVT